MIGIPYFYDRIKKQVKKLADKLRPDIVTFTQYWIGENIL